MFRMVSPTIIRSLRLHIQHQVYVIQILVAACLRERDGTGVWNSTLYMFRMVSPTIIRSLRLHIQHQVYVIQVLVAACLRERDGTGVWNSTLYMFRMVSPTQEFKTAHTASGICHTGSGCCLLAGTRWNCNSISFPLASSQQNLYDIYLMLYVQS